MRRRGRKAKCIWCGSGRTIGKGIRRTVTLGNRTIRLCRECGRRFTVGRARVQPAKVIEHDPKPTEPDYADTLPCPMQTPEQTNEPFDEFRI